MKSLLSFVTLTAALNVLTGCNLNGDALLGERPANQDEIIISAYSVCSQKALKETPSYGVYGCAIPNRLDDILNRASSDGNQFTFTFDAIAGNEYPTIRSLEVESFSYSSTQKVKKAECKEVSEPNSRFKKFACIVRDNSGTYDKYYPRKLELVNEACGSVAIFESKFPHPDCNTRGYSVSYLEGFYIANQYLEGIYATNSN